MKKKSAVKKVVEHKSTRFRQDIEDAQQLAKDLELNLQKLRKKLDALEHDPLIYGPKQVTRKSE